MGSRASFLTRVSCLRISGLVFPVKRLVGGRIQRVTLGTKLPDTHQGSDRNVYFLKGVGCGSFIHHFLKRGRKTIVRLRANGGVNARQKC